MDTISEGNGSKRFSPGFLPCMTGFIVVFTLLTACSQQPSVTPFPPSSSPTVSQSDLPLVSNTPSLSISPSPTEILPSSTLIPPTVEPTATTKPELTATVQALQAENSRIDQSLNELGISLPDEAAFSISDLGPTKVSIRVSLKLLKGIGKTTAQIPEDIQTTFGYYFLGVLSHQNNPEWDGYRNTNPADFLSNRKLIDIGKASLADGKPFRLTFTPEGQSAFGQTEASIQTLEINFLKKSEFKALRDKFIANQIPFADRKLSEYDLNKIPVLDQVDVGEMLLVRYNPQAKTSTLSIYYYDNYRTSGSVKNGVAPEYLTSSTTNFERYFSFLLSLRFVFEFSQGYFLQHQLADPEDKLGNTYTQIDPVAICLGPDVPAQFATVYTESRDLEREFQKAWKYCVNKFN